MAQWGRKLCCAAFLEGKVTASTKRMSSVHVSVQCTDYASQLHSNKKILDRISRRRA